MSKHPDPLGDAMKVFELGEAGRKAFPGIPLLARLDGRAFHTFTRGLHRPFGEFFTDTMDHCCIELVREFRASIGYVQSDEISLLFPRPEILFGGRFQKLHSVLAGFCSATFTRAWMNGGEDIDGAPPHFDCRVWQVPDRETALKVFYWREDDAIKNSIQAVARSLYSHKELHEKNSGQLQDLIHDKGQNWNNYPARQKRGGYYSRRVVERPIEEEDRLAIPEKHRPAPGTIVKRMVVEALDLPPIRRLKTSEALEILFPKERTDAD